MSVGHVQREARFADPRGGDDAILPALRAVIALTGADRGFVASRRADGPEPVFVAGLDRDGERLGATSFDPGLALARSVLESGRPAAAGNALCAPLAAEGALCVEARREWSADARRSFEDVASSISALYGSARLRDDLAASHARAVELNRRLEERLERQGVELERARADLQRAREELSLRHEYPEIVGRSAAVAKVLKLVDRVADTSFPVLIEGEPGTGKELVARAIHRASPRRDRPFLAVDCAALAGELLESELFGQVRGAFSGAHADRAGTFELASGGTILLDEVAETSKEMQATLLRVLQEGEVRRAGDKDARKVDVRVIAATRHDLQQRVKDGTFREELYYRLAVLKVRLPTLRDRKEDVPALTYALTAKHARAEKREPPRIDGDAMDALVAHDWPGNVRELEDAARYLLASGEARVTRPLVERFVARSRTHAPGAPADVAGLGASLTLRDVERLVIESRLRALEWHQKKTATSLGIDRKTLYRKIREFGIALEGTPPPEDLA